MKGYVKLYRWSCTSTQKLRIFIIMIFFVSSVLLLSNLQANFPENQEILEVSIAEKELESFIKFDGINRISEPSAPLNPIAANSIEYVPPSYIIITTNLIESNSLELERFIQYKQALGFQVRVITENEYGSDQGQDRAISIRNWLKDNYISKNIKYALLIGNPDPENLENSHDPSYGDVPMMLCWPRSGESIYQMSATDYFYADLTGDWDSDADNRYGEFGTGLNPQDDGVDFRAEIYVGRIPVYDEEYSALDEILKRIRTHHNQTYAEKTNILLPMAISNYENEDFSGYNKTDGQNFPEQLYTNVLEPLNMNDTVLYEQAGINATDPSAFHYDEGLTADTFRDNFNAGQGAVMWWGHGSDAGAYRKYWESDDGDTVPEDFEMEWETFIKTTTVSALDNDVPAFIYQSSCNNGNPENPNNLGYALLKHGAAISTVAASQVSWYAVGEWDETHWNAYSDNTGLGYNYMNFLLRMNETAGEALFRSKFYGGEDWDGASWMNKMDFNLYGDPQINYWGSLKPSIQDSSPELDAREIPSSIDLEVSVEDPDSTQLTVVFYNAADDTIIDSKYNVHNSSTASVTWSNLANDTVYEWYVTVGDDQAYIVSDTYNFTTFQEPAAPEWEPIPENHIFDYQQIWSYDVNATDPAGIAAYSVNNTDQFQIDANGTLSSLGFLDIGIYFLELSVNDTFGYVNTSTIWIKIIDSTPPSWDGENTIYHFEFGQNMEITILVSDPSGITSIAINSTHYFFLHDSIIISNKSFIPVGLYVLEINANDTLENQLTQQIQIIIEDTTLPTWGKNLEHITIQPDQPLWITVNATDLSPLSYNLNDTSLFTINENGTISNNTRLVSGDYNITIIISDLYGNWIENDLTITVLPSEDDHNDDDADNMDDTDDTDDTENPDNVDVSDNNRLNKGEENPIAFFFALGSIISIFIFVLSKSAKK